VDLYKTLEVSACKSALRSTVRDNRAISKLKDQLTLGWLVLSESPDCRSPSAPPHFLKSIRCVLHTVLTTSTSAL
jgi:hypothetical protein